MKRIKSASQLKLFLEAVAKEATNKAKKEVNEDMEKELEYFARGLETTKRSQSAYSKMMPLIEVEDEEENEADAADGEKSGEPEGAEDQIPASEPKPRNKAVIDIPLVEEEPEFEDIIKALGWLRAGASIKGDMKKEVQVYIDGLDEPEQKALYTMISSLANILHKEISGGEGQDPEDPPLNLVIDDPQEEEKEPNAPQEKSLETDADAPIKVGQSQSLNEMRRIVRKLMEK